MQTSFNAAFERDGCALAQDGLSSNECEALLSAMSAQPRDSSRGGVRHALSIPAVAALAAQPAIRERVHALLGSKAFAFKATYFEKSPGANWFVGWHQDIVVPVARQLEVPGFSRWSEKAGVQHTQPPRELLERIVAVRVNLDAATAENGSLEVLPGSHCSGILGGAEISAFIQTMAPLSCQTPAGGLVFMRPLLLHASARMVRATERRVLHFEFAASDLPGGLEWHTRLPIPIAY